MDKMYSAVLAGKNVIDVFNVTKGIKAYTLNLGNVEIINGPIVTQDKMTIVIKGKDNITRGKVYNLVKGLLIYSFQIR